MTVWSFDDLFQKLQSGDESVEIEAKRAEKFGNSMLETVSAFANEPNRNGGYLLLGVSLSEGKLFPEYEIVGVPNPDQLQADLATKCREMLSVSIRPVISVEKRNRKSIVVAYIPEAQPHEKPVYIKSMGLPRGAFRRIGSTDQHCTEEDLALFYQLRDHRSYDETPVAGTSLEDIDPRALAEYRRARAEVNPNAAELNFAEHELLRALGATGEDQGKPCLTIAGMMLFGKPASLRRHFPMVRVDYILVEGREWVPDPDHRYQTVEMLESLLTLIPRVVGHVLSDIPKAFSLGPESIHRRDVPLVPRNVIREAIVNALMHRSYRMRQPVQIIRYANRIEIRNPGHSLIPDDRLGEPGSLTRNDKIAAVLHEVGLAETKGTGIRAMREAMARANLTAPLFESDREKDTFTVTLLVHHLLGPDDVAWLSQFNECQLTDDEARALIVVREVGAINNALYRDINRVDTLSASVRLKRLRGLGLLEQKGKGAATYYVPTTKLLSPQLQRPGGLPQEASPLGKPLPEGLPVLPEGLPPLPEGLRQVLQHLGERSTPEDIRTAIRMLCDWQPLGHSQIATILGRNPRYIRDTYLAPMIRDGELEYVYPDNPAHPQQAYRSVRKASEQLNE